MKRVVIPELLDTDAGTPAEVEASLADLRLVNRWFGGNAVMCRLLSTVAVRAALTRISMLDVAAAAGDVPQDCRTRLAQSGLELEVTLLDRVANHLQRHTPAVAGDALALPFASGSFDVVGCSLFAHHLEPAEIVSFVNEGLRVCRVALLINDLRRHRLHLALTYLGSPLFRSRLTRHDGPASVRRAYTEEEMRELLTRTGAARLEISKHYLFRMGVIAWKDGARGH